MVRPDDKGFEYSWHLFGGHRGMANAHLGTFQGLESNKFIGGLWPNNGDGIS